MMLRDVLGREARGQVVDVAARLGQSLGVRVVRTEEHVVGTDGVDEFAEVVLVERAHVDVALELLDRVAVEGFGIFL